MGPQINSVQTKRGKVKGKRGVWVGSDVKKKAVFSNMPRRGGLKRGVYLTKKRVRQRRIGRRKGPGGKKTRRKKKGN